MDLSIENAVTENHPWRRFFARLIDTQLITYIVSFAGISFEPGVIRSIFRFTLLLLAFVPIEIIMIRFLNTTVGKYLMGIKVKSSNSEQVSITQSVKRALRVYASGEAFGIPLINLMAYLDGYTRLKEEGITTWDEAAGTDVTYSKVRFYKYILAIVLSAGPIALALVL